MSCPQRLCISAKIEQMISRDVDVRRAYARDASGLEMLPDAVARPSEVAHVIELLRDATAARTAVTAAGAQSSTTGASIADRGLLLSLRGLSDIHDVDTDTRSIRVGAGALVADVRRAAEAAQLLFTPDPTSEEECTIGGAIACNASGARSLRYGATGPHVRAISVVLIDGSELELRRPMLEKNTVGYPIAHDPVDLVNIIDAVIGLCAMTAAKKGIGITRTDNPNCHTRRRGDSLRLRQVLFNLVGNAVKFTEQGWIEITLNELPHGIRMQVIDTGIGIPVDHLPNLFQPFNQADTSDTRAHGGTGLGLAITKRLVELMGGELTLTSQVSKGTTVTIDLPLPKV